MIEYVSDEEFEEAMEHVVQQWADLLERLANEWEPS